jgi:hypothetical protein
MKKTILALGLGVIILTGCTPATMIYNGKKQNTLDIEEIIEDKLEAENPSMDLEISIMEETKDTKKKKTTH